MTISIAQCGELHVNCKDAFSKEAEQELNILKLLSLYDSNSGCYCHFTIQDVKFKALVIKETMQNEQNNKYLSGQTQRMYKNGKVEKEG